MVNFEKGFTWLFEDERWFDKLVAPILLTLIPILGGMAFNGYLLRSLKNVAMKDEHPLPEFDFGNDLERGFRWFLVNLVYVIPVMIAAFLLMILMIAMDNGGYSGYFSFFLFFMLLFIVIVYSIFIALVQPFAMANFAIENQFSSAFTFGDFLNRFRKEKSAWMMVFLAVLLSGIIASVAGIIPIVGNWLGGIYARFLLSNLAGQATSLENRMGFLEIE